MTVHGINFLVSNGGELAADVLVIGAGPGGVVVARTLVNAGLDVLLVDEGSYLPLASQPQALSQQMLLQWRGGGLTVALGTPAVAYAEGSCVGGGSEINSGIFQRCPGELLDRWADRYRISEFGEVALAPLYDEAASLVSARVPDHADPATGMLIQAGARLGWRTVRLPRADGGDGRKRSMVEALLPQALAGGLRLLARCRVTRLVIQQRQVSHAVAVARDFTGRRYRLRLRAQHVFLCGGAVHTPALLLRSGINRHVGRTLRFHPTIRCAVLFNRAVSTERSPVPLAAITEFMPDLRIGGSVFTPASLAIVLAEDWQERGWLLSRWRECGIYYAMVRAGGAGRIRVVPAMAEPVVEFALTEEDWRGLAEGVERLGEAMFAVGASIVYPSIRGHAGWTQAIHARQFHGIGLPRAQTNLMTIHLMGSCPLGEAEDRTATDSFGRVWSMDNLILADSSQIPEAPGVNPQATVMALALRAARHFLERF